MKLVSLNIEGQKHVKMVREFLQQEQADVVLMMEVFEDTLPKLTKGYPYVEFVPGYLADQDEEGLVVGGRKFGEVIMSKYPLSETKKTYLGPYSEDNLPKYGEDKHAAVLVTTGVKKAGREYQIGVVHGTWTEKGSVTERQRQEMGKMIDLLRGQELVLAGDFNIPRGNKIYLELARHFQDNIPLRVETTIDPVLHYANKKEPGRLKLVVDYIWSTPKYEVNEVRVVSGVSDHCALVGMVRKLI